MVPVTTRIPRKYLRAFEFYSEYYHVDPFEVMQADAYGQAVTFTDDVFWALEFMEDCHSLEDLQEITLEFSPVVHRLLSRVAELLRRPLDELLHGLLCAAGHVLEDYTNDALEKGGMEGPEMSFWADKAIQFARDARRDKSPMNTRGEDCWDAFRLQPVGRLEGLVALGKGGVA